MQIASTFHNNEQYYMEPLIQWYRKVWKADKFIFFIGTPKITQSNYHRGGIDFFVSTKEGITTYEYQHVFNQWDKWKYIFCDIIKSEHPGMGLWVDCDEFVYSKNIEQLKDRGERFATHFFEYVPISPFQMDSNSLWCEYSWYYREQALNNGEGSLHKSCKDFTLNSVADGGHMSTHNKYCNSKLKWNEYDNICFHVGVHSRNHFLYHKDFLQTHKYGPAINTRWIAEFEKTFDTYYAQCKYNTFVLNLYQTFIAPPT
jgi:hypothetical protein